MQVVEVLYGTAQTADVNYLLKVRLIRTRIARVVLLNQLLDQLDELSLVLRGRLHREQLEQHVLVCANALWRGHMRLPPMNDVEVLPLFDAET